MPNYHFSSQPSASSPKKKNQNDKKKIEGSGSRPAATLTAARPEVCGARSRAAHNNSLSSFLARRPCDAYALK